MKRTLLSRRGFLSGLAGLVACYSIPQEVYAKKPVLYAQTAKQVVHARTTEENPYAQEYRDFSAAWKQGLNAPREYVGSDDSPFVKNFIVPTSYKAEDDSRPNYWEEEIKDYSQIEQTISSLYKAFTGREFFEDLTV
ncbi:MAG: hypothetical protein AABX52_02680, partial [Nanoarchaeota archaeon]